MFRPFSGLAIIRLRLEYRRKHIYPYYNVHIKNGGTRSRFTMFGEVRSGISFPHSWCPHSSIWVFSDILVSTWWWSTQKWAETCSWFLQEFENTVLLRRIFIHLISISTESHNGDDAIKNVTFWLRDASTSLTFKNCTLCPLCIYVLCKQRLVPLTAFYNEMKSVYSAVGTGPLNKAVCACATYSINWLLFITRWKVFTARYGLGL
jgi:hypothetical protein